MGGQVDEQIPVKTRTDLCLPRGQSGADVAKSMHLQCATERHQENSFILWNIRFLNVYITYENTSISPKHV